MKYRYDFHKVDDLWWVMQELSNNAWLWIENTYIETPFWDKIWLWIPFDWTLEFYDELNLNEQVWNYCIY